MIGKIRALEIGKWAHKTPTKYYQSTSEVCHFARAVKHFSFPQRSRNTNIDFPNIASNIKGQSITESIKRHFTQSVHRVLDHTEMDR